MLEKIILDNTVFNYFGAIRSIPFLDLVITHLKTPFYVSEVVFTEANRPGLLTKYPDVVPLLLDHIQPEGRVFRLCSTFDEFLKQELEMHMDEGEAESIAQAYAIHSTVFVSDDLKAAKRLESIQRKKKGIQLAESFRMVSSFFLLAHLEALSILSKEEFEMAKYQYYEARKFFLQSSGTQQAFIEARMEEMRFAYEVLGIPISRESLMDKCGAD